MIPFPLFNRYGFTRADWEALNPADRYRIIYACAPDRIRQFETSAWYRKQESVQIMNPAYHPWQWEWSNKTRQAWAWLIRWMKGFANLEQISGCEHIWQR